MSGLSRGTQSLGLRSKFEAQDFAVGFSSTGVTRLRVQETHVDVWDPGSGMGFDDTERSPGVLIQDHAARIVVLAPNLEIRDIHWAIVANGEISHHDGTEPAFLPGEVNQRYIQTGVNRSP